MYTLGLSNSDYSNTMKKSENVPKLIKDRYEEIVSITNSFSQKHLNEEYAQEIRYAVAALCRKRPYIRKRQSINLGLRCHSCNRDG